MMMLDLTNKLIAAFLRQLKLFSRLSTDRELQLERVLLSD